MMEAFKKSTENAWGQVLIKRHKKKSQGKLTEAAEIKTFLHALLNEWVDLQSLLHWELGQNDCHIALCGFLGLSAWRGVDRVIHTLLRPLVK